MMQAHEYLPYDIPLAAATALNAGVDYNCGCVLLNGTAAAIGRGLTNETMVDAAISRILHVLFALGEFDPEVPYRSLGAESFGSPANAGEAMEAALQGLTLLKNERGALPLPRAARLAFIGPNADDAGALQSSYGGECQMCAQHTPWRAAQRAGLNATLTRGCGVMDDDASGIPAAAAAAAAADVAVLFLGSTFAWESEWGNGPGCQNDRVNLTLPGVQGQLLAAVVAAGKPVVVVLLNGGAIAVEGWLGGVGALVEAFYPGEMGGDAIVSALLGDSNRWGALPFTMYTNAIVGRDYYRNESAGLSYDGGITHMFYSGDKGPPTFPFGFGLSYTTFSYAWAQGAPPPPAVRTAAASALNPTAPLISYAVNVTNTGLVAGDVRSLPPHLPPLPAPPPPRSQPQPQQAIALALVVGDGVEVPLERLWQFARVALAPGETQTINFDASAHDVSSVRADGSRWLAPGALEVVVGDRHAPLRHALRLEGPALQLPVFPAPPGKPPAPVGPLRSP
jgi:hypothetical protein